MKLTFEALETIFDQIEAKWEGDNAFKGLQIIAKYSDEVITGAGHDIIYSADASDCIDAGLTEEDAIALRKLNWMIEDEGYFSCFV